MRGIGLYANSDKTEFMCFNQDGTISSLNEKPLKLIDPFTYFGSNISSTESDLNIHIGKAGTWIDRLMKIWKSDISYKINWKFFQLVHLDSNVTLWEKVWWELHKLAIYCFEYILKAASYKTAVV